MNKIIVCILLLGIYLRTAAQQSCPLTAASCNITLQSRWDNDSLPFIGNQSYNSVWGYYDSAKGREYAILGGIENTFFIDVTNPTAPVLRDTEPGRSKNCIHREYKNYKNYLYAVADEGLASLQIFDMQYLPDSVHKVYDSDSLCVRSHTLFIERDRLYLNSNTTKHGYFAMSILSIADPENPVLLAHFNSPSFNGSPLFTHVHDIYVRNDTAFCSNGSAGLFIYDLTNPVSPVLLNAHTAYPDKGYNHSSAVSPDGNILVFTDETLNMGVKIYDSHDVKNLGLKSIFKSHEGAVAHNPYILGDFIYLSYYHDGIYIYNMKIPQEPYVAGYYDTYPQNPDSVYQGYEGCWGIYPFLPSGNILASDMSNGLFVLKAATVLGIKKETPAVALQVSPNPFSGEINVGINSSFTQKVSLSVYDLMGKELYSLSAILETGANSITVPDLSAMSPGMYFLKVSGRDVNASVKLLKQ